MEIKILKIGNSKGLVIPRPLLAQAGLENQVCADITVVNDTIVLRKLEKPVRHGWAEAATALAASGEDQLLLGDFDNAYDEEINW